MMTDKNYFSSAHNILSTTRLKYKTTGEQPAPQLKTKTAIGKS